MLAEETRTELSPSDRDAIEQQKIRNCLARYCRGVDRRDAAMIESTYWPGAVDDHVVFVGPMEEFMVWVMPLLESMPLTQHNLGHSYIEMHGDVAMVETCFTAYHRVPIDGEDRDIMLGARYADRMERRDGEWRIAHRILVQDWIRDEGPSHDWSQGALGMSFIHEEGVGRSHGDATVDFFRTLGKSAIR